jgi:L-amino acid N-acyltransferase YncA
MSGTHGSTDPHDTRRRDQDQLTVRPMLDDEAAEVRAIAERAFERFDMLLFSTRGKDVLVATGADDRILGAIVLHASDAGALGPLGVVHFVFADPDAGVPGIGSALRDAADVRFAELGCTETSARIDVINSASQALHRAGGYRVATVAEQWRRWGWRLPLRWWQAGTGFDPGMQLWLRPAPDDRPTDDRVGPADDHASRPGRALAVTAALNLLLLAVVAWRAPRGGLDAASTVLTLTLTVSVLLGLREAAIRLVARRDDTVLGHVPWTNGLPLATALAAAFGVWFPLTGSSTSQRPGWRHDREIAALGRAHLAGALVVAGLAWAAALIEPGIDWLAWAEVRRAAVMLALFDVALGFSPMIGTAARHVRRWSTPTWLALAAIGIGPLVTTLV